MKKIILILTCYIISVSVFAAQCPNPSEIKLSSENLLAAPILPAGWKWLTSYVAPIPEEGITKFSAFLDQKMLFSGASTTKIYMGNTIERKSIDPNLKLSIDWCEYAQYSPKDKGFIVLTIRPIDDNVSSRTTGDFISNNNWMLITMEPDYTIGYWLSGQWFICSAFDQNLSRCSW